MRFAADKEVKGCLLILSLNPEVSFDGVEGFEVVIDSMFSSFPFSVYIFISLL